MRRLVKAAALTLSLFILCTLHESTSHAAFDPELHFYTIETPHFRIAYHSGLKEVAEHVASTAESLQERMGEAMGYSPSRDKTEIALLDTTESANGAATALPYNAIYLYVTAPEDFSPLGDVDDWYLELITHEYTHVVHTDHIRGLPSLVNAIFGKTLAPNQAQPRWILEGFATYFESARTSGGRMRNTIWDMYLRTDVLEDNVASLAEVTNYVRRWPQGSLPYLYGSHFIDWIARTYGEDTLRRISRDYGGQTIPYGIQRSARRVTGKTYDELYTAWIASLHAHYETVAREVRTAGLREGVRLTHHGQTARYPRWIPEHAWPEHRGGLLYFRDDQHQRQGLVALDLTRDESGQVLSAREPEAELIARTAVESYASFLPDGALVFNSADYHRNVFLFGNLERMPSGGRSPYGVADGGRTQLTAPRERCASPATSPDGTRVVYTKNRAGTRAIFIADLTSEGLVSERPLVPTAFLEQAFTPRWSPDGTRIAYSVWKRGGARDIRLVDVRDGRFTDITSDRAVDGGPSFSNDGRWLFFHSDRTGISNLYAYELASGTLKQVTNVLTGAYSPEISPDGKTLAYVGYNKSGFDLYALKVDEATWTEAAPYTERYPPMPPIPERRWESVPYKPWRTLRPRAYSASLAPGSFGQAAALAASGADISGLHGVALTSTVEFEKPELQGSLSYRYSGLPVDFSASVFRTIAPRSGYALGQYKPVVVQESAGMTTSLSYSQPRAFDSRTYAISHSVYRLGVERPMPLEKLDPYETPSLPPRGLASTVGFSYAFSNAEGFLWSVGPERGFSASLSVNVSDPMLGSSVSGFVANGDFTTYLRMPWLKHHALALHAGGGTSGGTVPGSGAFYVGGFVDLPLVDTVRNALIQGGITLRGYPPTVISGRSYALTNAEYRFPILNVDRGDSTLPIFLNRISGAVFVDYGSAFDELRDSRFKTGVGGELWSDWYLAYLLPFTFRLGYARGLARLGIDKFYFVAAVPY
jgi:hypothetical protein